MFMTILSLKVPHPAALAGSRQSVYNSGHLPANILQGSSLSLQRKLGILLNLSHALNLNITKLFLKMYNKYLGIQHGIQK